MAKGPGTLTEQIKSLRTKLSEEGLAAAEKLATSADETVLTLAYKLMRLRESHKVKLPKSVTKMLANLSEKDAELVLNKLTGRK